MSQLNDVVKGRGGAIAHTVDDATGGGGGAAAPQRPDGYVSAGSAAGSAAVSSSSNPSWKSTSHTDNASPVRTGALVAVIGGGPGGYEAATVAARMGAQVTLIEARGLGGSAVLTDVVPSKTLIATSEQTQETQLAAELGANEKIAKRAGLLHDIGKAVDRLLSGDRLHAGGGAVRRCGGFCRGGGGCWSRGRSVIGAAARERKGHGGCQHAG